MNQEPSVSEEAPKVKPLRANLSKACFDLSSEIPAMIRHWPKVSRMGIGRKLEEHIFQLLDSAVYVSNPTELKEDKVRVLQNMSTKTDCILVYLRLGLEASDIDQKRYRRLSDLTTDIGRQVGGLKKFITRKNVHV